MLHLGFDNVCSPTGINCCPTGVIELNLLGLGTGVQERTARAV